MITKSMIRRGSAKKLSLLMGFFVLAIMAIFAMSIEKTTYAEVSMLSGHEHTVKGEIVTIENLHRLGMVTLRSDQIGNFPSDRLNIFLTRNTVVTACNAHEPLKDMNVDHNATIMYHEVRGLLPVADSIRELC